MEREEQQEMISPVEEKETEKVSEGEETLSGQEEKLDETSSSDASDESSSQLEEEDEFTPHAPTGHTRLVTNQGLTADKYAVSQPWIESDRLSEEEEAELSGIEIQYDMKKEEIVPGMKAFQHRVSFKKNMIYTAILAVIVVLYAQAVWTDPSYDTGKLFIGIAIFVMFMLWFMPARHIQNTVKAIESEAATYRLTVTPVGILIPDGDGKYLVRYSTPAMAVIELPNAFTICVSREKVFIVPKRCIPPEQMPEVKRMMKQGLQERYLERN